MQVFFEYLDLFCEHSLKLANQLIALLFIKFLQVHECALHQVLLFFSVVLIRFNHFVGNFTFFLLLLYDGDGILVIKRLHFLDCLSNIEFAQMLNEVGISHQWVVLVYVAQFGSYAFSA